jgi:hypothetical protein
MVTVDCGSSLATTKSKLTKKELVESLDYNIVQIENERMRIEHLEETCIDMVDDVRQSNHAKKMDQMANDILPFRLG